MTNLKAKPVSSSKLQSHENMPKKLKRRKLSQSPWKSSKEIEQNLTENPVRIQYLLQNSTNNTSNPPSLTPKKPNLHANNATNEQELPEKGREKNSKRK